MDTQSFRETVRTVTVSYPVPFIFAVSLAVALFCLAGAAFVAGPLAWLFAATGCTAMLNSFALCWYAAIRKPELLRSERQSLINRYMDMMADSEIDIDIRNQISKTITGIVTELDPKVLGSGAGARNPSTNEDQSDA